MTEENINKLKHLLNRRTQLEEKIERFDDIFGMQEEYLYFEIRHHDNGCLIDSIKDQGGVIMEALHKIHDMLCKEYAEVQKEIEKI